MKTITQRDLYPLPSGMLPRLLPPPPPPHKDNTRITHQQKQESDHPERKPGTARCIDA